jgi:two-component system sensor histidine kinase KdpD
MGVADTSCLSVAQGSYADLVRILVRRVIRHPASGFVCISTLLAALTWALAPAADGASPLLNATLLMLLGALVSAAFWGFPVGLYAAVLADLLVNFFFVPPVHTLTVAAPHNVVALLLFLAVAAVGASMLSLLRREVRLAEARTLEANVLLGLSQATAAATDPANALEVIASEVCRVFGATGCRVLATGPQGWTMAAQRGVFASAEVTRDEGAMADEALRSLRSVGRGSASLRHLSRSAAATRELFVPFPDGAPERGVVHVIGALDRLQGTDPGRLLASFAAEASVALHRLRLAAEAERAESFRRSDELKSLLLASLSHDLRSPLTAVKAAISNLRDEAVDWSAQDVEGFLETIEDETDRLSTTVDDLLQLSRLEAGVVQTQPEPVQVALLLRDAVQSAASITGHHVVLVEADLRTWVMADYRLLSQAVANLIQNAVHYSVPGGRIVVAAEGSGDRVALIVRDDGPLIPEAERVHLFDRFFRGVRGRQSPGTGLGLAIVEAIARLSGGGVTARAWGSGNELGFWVPASEAPR